MAWDWNIGQWFTPPKSKSPWEAMTTGSTGGWAAPIKNWGPVITAIAGAVPYVGPFLSAGLGAIGAAGTGGFQGTDKGWSNVGSTLWGGLAGYGLGGIGAGVGQGASNVLSGYGLGSFGQGFAKGAGNYFSPLTNALSKFGIGSGNAISAGSKAGMYDAAASYVPAGATYPYPQAGISGSSLFASEPILNFGGANTMLAGASQGANIALQGNNLLTKGAVAGNNSFLNGQTLLGLGMLGASAIPQTPKYAGEPMIGEMTSRLLGGQGISEVGAASRSKLMEMLKADPYTVPDAYFKAATRRIDESYAQAEKDLVKRYKHYGGEDSTDFRNQIRKLRTDQANEKAAIGAELEYANYQATMNRTYDAIKTGIGVDDATMRDLLGLTQLSAEEAAIRYGADVADVQSLREILGQGGAMMIQGSMNNQMNNNYLNTMAMLYGGGK